MVLAQKAHTDVKMDLWLVSACLSQTDWNTAAEHKALIIQQPDQSCRTCPNWWATFTFLWACVLNIVFLSQKSTKAQVITGMPLSQASPQIISKRRPFATNKSSVYHVILTSTNGCYLYCDTTYSTMSHFFLLSFSVLWFLRLWLVGFTVTICWHVQDHL